MSNNSNSPELSNFTFFAEKWPTDSPPSHKILPSLAESLNKQPQNSRENSSNISFAPSMPNTSDSPKDPKRYHKTAIDHVKEDISPSKLSSQTKLLAHKRSASSLLHRNGPNSATTLGLRQDVTGRPSKRKGPVENVRKPKILSNEAQESDMNVSDIRRRMRNYHPVSSFKDTSNDSGSSFSEFNQQMMKDFREEKKAEKLSSQLKLIKHQSIDKLFDEIRDQSDKRIGDIVQGLKTIKKKDVDFHVRVAEELDELRFLRKELGQGFERLQHKDASCCKEKLMKRLEAKVHKTCSCCNKVQDTRPLNSRLSNRKSSLPELKRTASESRGSAGLSNSEMAIEDFSMPRKSELFETQPHIEKFSGFSEPHSPPKAKKLLLDGRTNEDTGSDKCAAKVDIKFIVPSERKRPSSQMDIFRNWVRNPTPNSPESRREQKTGYSSSQLPKNKITRQRSIQNSMMDSDVAMDVNNTSSPEQCFVKLINLSKSPNHFRLKFTGASISFEVEIKPNETIPINFGKRNHAMIPKIPASPYSSENKSYRPSLNNSKAENESKFFSEKETNSSLVLAHKIQAKEIKSSECQDCIKRLEGVKMMLEDFSELDQKAIEMDGSYTEDIHQMLLRKDQAQDKHTYSDVDVKNGLLRVCKGIEQFIESCFEMAPIHSEKIEKLFKGLLFFFELKVRLFMQSQKLMEQEVEEVKLFVKERRMMQSNLQQARENNSKLNEEILGLQERLKAVNKQQEDRVIQARVLFPQQRRRSIKD